MRRNLYEPDHEAFREVVQAYVKREVTPHLDGGRPNLIRPAPGCRRASTGCSAAVPERFGGGGTADYRFRCVLGEELAAVGAASLNSGFALQDDISIPYLLRLGTEEQQARWLPGLCSGE